MTTNHHTAISTGAAANASTFNNPLGQLDAQITTNATSITGLSSTVTTLQNSIILGGAAVTLTNGAASAAQKVVTVDSSAQFVAGCYVEYTLVGGVVERNTVDTVDSGTQITLITNIGTGGIADNSPVAVIPVGFYHAGYSTYNVLDYGATGNGTTDDTAAIQAAIYAAVVTGGTVLLPAGRYKTTAALDLCDTKNVILRGTAKSNPGETTGTTIDCHNSNGAIIEIIGSHNISIFDLVIEGDATNTPAVGIWTGRSTAVGGLNTSQIFIERIVYYGAFTKACHLIMGCESNQFDQCYFYPTNAACLADIMFDFRNIINLTPEHATLDVTIDTAYTTIDRSFLTMDGAATSCSPIYIVAGEGPIVRNTYLCCYGAPVVNWIGGSSGIGVRMEYCSVEQTPTYFIFGDYHASYTNTFRFSLIGCGASNAASSGYDLYFDDSTTVQDTVIDQCYFLGNMRFYDLTETTIGRWEWYSATARSITVTHQLNGCEMHIGSSDTLSLPVANYNSVVYYNSAGGGSNGYLALMHGLVVDQAKAPNNTNQAVIRRVLHGTTTWDPGSLNDGASATKSVAVTGPIAADEWFCMAHFSSLTTGAWTLSAYAQDSAVLVVLTNHTGAPVDLASGTVSVVAWKVAESA